MADASLDAELVQLVGGIYDAVIDPDRWPEVCERICAEFEFFNAEMSVINVARNTVVTSVALNIPQELQYLRTPGGVADLIGMWGGAAHMAAWPLEEPARASDQTDATEWATKYKYFREFSVPQGIVDIVGIPLARSRTLIGNIGFAKHKSARLVSERDFARLRAIGPHLRRAVVISGILDEAMNKLATFSATLEAIPTAVVIVDDDMQIIHANAAAQPMLAAGDPILNDAGRLQVFKELLAGQLALAVRAVADEATLGRRGLGIPARRRNGQPVTLTVMPLQKRSLRGGVSTRAAAAILIAQAEPLQMPSDALSLLYDLTPAEVRVFELVIEGGSNESVAKTLGVSLATVKSHMIHVLEKTGARNRVALVTLAHSIKLPG